MTASRETLHAIRAICAVGIVVAHVFPSLFWFTGGHTWRVQTMYLLGGASILVVRPLKATLKYVSLRIYGYMILWTAVYWVAISLMPSDVKNNLMKDFSVIELISVQLLKSNSHAIWPLLGMWFLIPFGVALILASMAWRRFGGGGIIIAGLMAVCGGWLLGSSDPAPFWVVRLVGQIAIAFGYMLLGAALLSSERAVNFLENGVVAATSLLIYTWLGTTYTDGGMIISWLVRRGNIAPQVIQSIAIFPAVFWFASRLSCSQVVVFVGKKSKDVMTHHLMPVVFFNLILVYFGVSTFRDVKLSAFYNANVLWPVYLLLGLSVPVLGSFYGGKLKKVCREWVEGAVRSPIQRSSFKSRGGASPADDVVRST
ncbi:hypothetical protein [Camelimonas lactis]|uniref:Fucose 4-O-acetylase-like acetyltransferase n=1 Tax=Camelimonas lactis TaxID=659006 RepID=A0A4V2RXV2_9HYPH|nr:hypothetical protein [Camelimonas lactis]TCO15888.1 hypothetical protein EV666_101137 [Camelimonas lactis]